MEEEDKNGNEERSSLARSHAFATDGGRWRTDRNLAAVAYRRRTSLQFTPVRARARQKAKY